VTAFENGVSNPHRIIEEINERLAMVSDIGKKHTHNEDCGTVAKGGYEEAILIIADGVSTSFHPAGASAAAAKIIKEMLLTDYTTDEALAVMKLAIATAHETIRALPSGDNPDLDGPECTVVAAKISGEMITIGWVGDSRAYLVTETAEKLLTIDDSWVEEVVKAGLYTREEANSDRRAHYVTQVLGMKDEEVEIHIISKEIAPNETLLLCSDGLWNYFQQDGSLARMIGKVKENVGANLTANAICQALVEEANVQGGHDNITVAIFLG
jgi:serine/threonine protein phosphatase PrpC